MGWVLQTVLLEASSRRHECTVYYFGLYCVLTLSEALMEWLRRRMRRRSYVMRVEELKRRIGSILYRSILLCFLPVHAFVGRGVGEAEGFRVRRGWRAATDQQAPSQSYLVSQSSGSNPADVRARTWEIFLPGKNVVFRRRKNSMLRMLAA